MTTIDKQQDTSIAKLNLRHDQEYSQKLSLESTQRNAKENEKIDQVLTEMGEEVTTKVEKKKSKAKADVEKDAKKDQVSSSTRLTSQQVASQQAPVLKAPERKLQEQESAPQDDPAETNKKLAEETNFIAVMAESMTEGIRTGQAMFQIDWNQSSSDWQNQLAHASAIQTAMTQSGNAQKAATDEQAYRSKYDGIINVSMAGLSLVIGLGGAAKEAWDAEKQAANQVGAEADKLKSASSAAADAEGAAAKTASALEKDAATTANSAGKEAQLRNKATSSEWWDAQEKETAAKSKAANKVATAGQGSGPTGNPRLDAAKQGISTAGKLMQGVYQGFIKAAQIGVPLQMMAQGSCGVGVDSPSQSREANDQRDAAIAQAQSEALQLHASGYGEHYNKTEDARQAVSSAIKFFTDEFQSVPGTIVQALGSYHV